VLRNANYKTSLKLSVLEQLSSCLFKCFEKWKAGGDYIMFRELAEQFMTNTIL